MNLDRILTILITILILLTLVFPLSNIITKKRVIVVGNAPDNSSSPTTRLPRSRTATMQIMNKPLGSRTVVFSNNDEEKRVNAIFLGVPGKGNSAPNLTDTLMVISIDEKTKEGFLLSIPRDFFVKLPGTDFYTKINDVYQKGGIESVKTILTEITGLNFDYNIVIDLEGVKKIIDEIGGIDILVEEDVYDPAFPGPNNSYQLFTLEAGWQHLDGETALKYIRTRHDPTGDFARVRRQQKVLVALKEKISSLNLLKDLSAISSVWQTLTNHFKTNLDLQNILTFWEITKDIDLKKIEFKVLDPTTGLVVSDHATLGSARAYILRPKAGLGNYSEIKNFIKSLIP